ncbi:MAG: site-specific integrase [Polyangiaceae bacterium]
MTEVSPRRPLAFALPNRARGRARGFDRADLFTSDETRKAITFHDLRATGITWCAVRGDDALKIKQRAGHASFSTTEGYIREAENMRDGFGAVFPALPADLLARGPVRPTPRRREVSASVTAFGVAGLLKPGKTGSILSGRRDLERPTGKTAATCVRRGKIPGRCSAELHVLVAGGSFGRADRALDSICHELQVRWALRDALGGRRAMRQHEYRRAVDWMAPTPTVRDVVGSSAEHERAGLVEHPLHLVEVRAGGRLEERRTVLIHARVVPVEDAPSAVFAQGKRRTIVRSGNVAVE